MLDFEKYINKDMRNKAKAYVNIIENKYDGSKNKSKEQREVLEGKWFKIIQITKQIYRVGTILGKCVTEEQWFG